MKYRVKQPNGMMAGGPMYALERGLGSKPLGMLFAALTAIAAFGIGNMTQANSISALASETFGVSPWITGIVMTALTAIVILGGITRSPACARSSCRSWRCSTCSAASS